MVPTQERSYGFLIVTVERSFFFNLIRNMDSANYKRGNY